MDLIRYGYNGRLLTILLDRTGIPWLAADEVCEVVPLKDAARAIDALDEGERRSVPLDGASPGNPTRLIINASGIYSLIFMSHTPEARAFKEWLTHELLPSLRTMDGNAAGEGGGSFRNVVEALDYVQASGLSIRKSKMYQDVKKGLLTRNSDGTISKSAVEKYIRIHRESGLPKYGGDSCRITRLCSRVSRQQRDVLNILETSYKIARRLGLSKEDAIAIAKTKVEETTGIRLDDLYARPSGGYRADRQSGDPAIEIDEHLMEDFIDDNCEIGDGYKVGLSVIYERFCEWFAMSFGDNNPPCMEIFSEHLSTLVDRTQHAGTIFHGIRLSTREPQS